jgi:hypothetical protein
MDLTVKIAAFCRELGDSALQEMAQRQNMEPVYKRAEESLKAGRVGPELEADLDVLDDMVRRVEGQGLYPGATRSYQPLPGGGAGTGAQWWTCPRPRNRCAGRGRVRAGQQPSVCGVTGEPLVPGPLPE